MILNTGTSSVEVIGDITEFKTGIDPKNLEFITTLLSSNLYSNPEQSFLREIVSNAWDSHVEAGNTETPVLIKINSNEVTIRDFGTGLSPERFKEVYCNIGSSTKRESNDYIGAFGIGHLSVLSCSNTAYVTSYYEGKAYQYITIKDGNTITNNLVCILDTEEPNGLEVSIKNIKCTTPYNKALESLVFFPNIYVEGNYDINNCKIRHFNNFASSTIDSKECLLLGNVLYPLDTNIIKFENGKYKTFIEQLKYSGLAIKFSIGELEVTPNRENIIYNDSTINIIKQRIVDAYDEMLGILNENVTWNFDTLEEAFDMQDTSLVFDFVELKAFSLNKGKVMFYYWENKELYNKITYKGVPYVLYNNYRTLRNHTIPGLRGVIYQDKVFVGKIPLYCSKLSYVRNNKTVVIPKDLKLTSIIKDWLLINYPKHAIVSPVTFEEYCTSFEMWTDNIDKPLLKEMYDNMNKNAVILDFDNNDNFKQYKASVLAEREQNRKANKNNAIKNVLIYRVLAPRYKSKYDFLDSDKAIEYLMKRNVSFIFISIEDYLEWCTPDLYKNLEGVEVWTANKSVLKLLKESKLPKFNIEAYTNKSMLTMAKTIYDHYTSIKCLYNMNILPENLQDKCCKYIKIVDKFGNKTALRYCSHISKDSSLEEELKKLEDIYNMVEGTRVSLGISEITMSDSISKAILHYYLFKNKLLRINYDCYKATINHPLIKMLCKK